MPTPGYVFKDGGPIPDDELKAQQETVGEGPETGLHAFSSILSKSNSQSSQTMAAAQSTQQTPTTTATGSPVLTPSSSKSAVLQQEAPTDSHALAQADHELKGTSQVEHDGTEVKDLGWSEHPDNMSKPLVGGIKNEDVWMLVRRFDKQMYHVKAIPDHPMGGLDLNTANEDEFSPDKLRANLERLYMTVIIGVIGFGKHIARLRSWREPRRTGAFAAVYLVAWIFNFIVPALFTTIVVLIAVPQARALLFPPAPLALVSSKTGGVQTPQAGVLGSHDSVTGAPEKHKGEAVEQEASNFVSGFASIAISSAAGKHEPANADADPVNESAPDPTNIVTASADAQTSAAGGNASAKHDKTKQPMEEAMWTKMRPIMHVVGDISDAWERCANALSPTPPFPQEFPRLKLASLLVPVIAVALLTTSAVFMKMNTAVIGFTFFGDPLIWRGVDYLNKNYPNWQDLLQVENTILKGVPTNAQLTITLLRIGEVNKAPLPPPPTSDEPPESRPISLHEEDIGTLDGSHAEIQDAIHKNDGDDATLSSVGSDKPKKKSNVGTKILGVLKGTTKAGVETSMGADALRAKVGSSRAKDHLGVLPKLKEQIAPGPVDFKARYKGRKGWVYIDTSATVPCVAFSSHQSDGTGEQHAVELKPQWSIPIQEIQELKKVGGLGWKAKLIVGWATNKTVVDGLEIVDKQGQSYKCTAIVLRDELFNRLVAMGTQMWESW